MIKNRKINWLWPLAWALLGGAGAAAGKALWAVPGQGGARAWLRDLSLSGPGGNLLAWALVLALSALPALGLLWRGRRRADWLLLLAGAEAFAGLYFWVNPALIFPPELAVIPGLEQGWALAAGCGVAGTLAAWALLRLLGALEQSPAGLLPGLLRWASAVYGALAGASSVLDALRAVETVSANNTDQTRVMSSAALLWTLAVLKLIPSILGAWALLWGGELSRALDQDPFAGGTVALAESVARRCAWAARWALLTAVGCNLLQLICAPAVASVSFSVYLPLGTLALCAALLVLCRYFRRAKAVSDDNESII